MTNQDFPVAIEVFHSAFGDGWRKVADVPIHGIQTIDEACEFAYRLTNSIDAPWWENDGVTPTEEVKQEGGCRSTSVDDHLKVTWMKRPPTYYRVAPVGFTPAKLTDIVMENVLSNCTFFATDD